MGGTIAARGAPRNGFWRGSLANAPLLAAREVAGSRMRQGTLVRLRAHFDDAARQLVGTVA
jgi:hypothetical protein